MSKSILITGATGTLGLDLIPELLATTDANLVLLVHAKGHGMTSGEILNRHYSLPSSTRVSVVSGDITQPRMGLSDIDYNRVQKTTTHILHAAADTRFDQSIEDVARTNVAGTRNVLEFATRCLRLTACGYVSTAYVAGRRKGLIREAELVHQAGFVNTYETSKYRAEEIVQSYSDRVPLAVYRLSTIAGNSSSGTVRKMDALHHALRIMHLGLAAMIPGSPDYQLDLITGEVASRTIVTLLVYKFVSGTTYHITSDPRNRYRLADAIATAYQTFADFDSEWSRKNFPRPIIAPQRAFDSFVSSIRASRNTVLIQALDNVQYFASQLTLPKDFDQQNVLAAIPRFSVDQPVPETYFPRVIEYCLRTHWGRYAA